MARVRSGGEFPTGDPEPSGCLLDDPAANARQPWPGTINGEYSMSLALIHWLLPSPLSIAWLKSLLSG